MCIKDFNNIDESLEVKFMIHYYRIVSDNYNFQHMILKIL